MTALMLSPLVCGCAAGASAPAEAPPASHACCVGDESAAPTDAPPFGGHQHAPDCQHCTNDRPASVVAERSPVGPLVTLLQADAPLLHHVAVQIDRSAPIGHDAIARLRTDSAPRPTCFG